MGKSIKLLSSALPSLKNSCANAEQRALLSEGRQAASTSPRWEEAIQKHWQTISQKLQQGSSSPPAPAQGTAASLKPSSLIPALQLGRAGCFPTASGEGTCMDVIHSNAALFCTKILLSDSQIGQIRSLCCHWGVSKVLPTIWNWKLVSLGTRFISSLVHT